MQFYIQSIFLEYSIFKPYSFNWRKKHEKLYLFSENIGGVVVAEVIEVNLPGKAS